ncbi:hypothetical protein ACH4E8_18125 [Streptomyces sp. NPDC017979]|uniref:hypothetical protein n=1 Tax=Streptomyces sp. NPDC017979 TaxID=3365024 RepID=UPI0037ACCDF6
MAGRGLVRVPVVAWGLGLVAFVGGVLWWWAVLRLLTVPERVGLVEGAVAAGGWGLSLLPVHVTAFAGRRGAARLRGEALTEAWRRRRSGG